MATNNIIGLMLLFVSATAGAREAASPSSCQAAAAQPAIANTKAALDRDPTDLPARFKLADAWSDAGCFNEALQVLQSGRELHPESKELETRLRVARSLVGEETYFENLDRANDDAKLKRDTFRCTTLADVDACGEALRMKPEDPALLVAQGDALVRAKRPAEALGRYRRAAALAPGLPDVASKISAAEAQSPIPPPGAPAASGRSSARGEAAVARVPKAVPDARMARADPGDTAHSARRYSNADPVTRSH
jgi:tetratricopeptide (TPR) repeat protein